MKKILIIAVILLAVMAVVRSQRSDRNDSTLVSPTPTPEEYTLAVLSNDVWLKNPSDTNFIKISGTTAVTAGSEIKTSATGRAQLLYPNGTLTGIEENSHIKITALDDSGDQSRLEIIVGGLMSKIKNALGGNDYYEVQTENVVASVRGTIFTTQFHNGVSEIVGIENTVHVSAKDPKTKQLIKDALANLASGQKIVIDNAALPKVGVALRTMVMNDPDFQKQPLKRNVIKHLKKDDVSNAQVRNFVRTLYQKNSADKEYLRDLIKEHLYEPSVSPSPTSTMTPRATATSTATVTPKVSTTTTTSATPTPTSTPTPTATVVVNTTPVLESLYPKTVSAGQQFTINGQYFLVGRNMPQITAVFIGSTSVAFSIVDSLTIFASAPSSYGTYDVSVVTTAGAKLTLPQALSVSYY